MLTDWNQIKHHLWIIGCAVWVSSSALQDQFIIYVMYKIKKDVPIIPDFSEQQVCGIVTC